MRGSIRDAWLTSADKRKEDLAREERADLAAVLGAQMALLSSVDPVYGLEELAALAARPLGTTMVTTLAALRES